MTLFDFFDVSGTLVMTLFGTKFKVFIKALLRLLARALLIKSQLALLLC